MRRINEFFMSAAIKLGRTEQGKPGPMHTFLDFALSHFKEPKGLTFFQIGLVNPNNNLSYRWSDGTLTDFTNWKAGSPSDYLYTCIFWSEDGSERGRWDDYNGGWSYPICQFMAALPAAAKPSAATSRTPATASTSTTTTATTTTTTPTTTTTKKGCRLWFLC